MFPLRSLFLVPLAFCCQISLSKVSKLLQLVSGSIRMLTRTFATSPIRILLSPHIPFCYLKFMLYSLLSILSFVQLTYMYTSCLFLLLFERARAWLHSRARSGFTRTMSCSRQPVRDSEKTDDRSSRTWTTTTMRCSHSRPPCSRETSGTTGSPPTPAGRLSRLISTKIDYTLHLFIMKCLNQKCLGTCFLAIF